MLGWFTPRCTLAIDPKVTLNPGAVTLAALPTGPKLSVVRRGREARVPGHAVLQRRTLSATW